MRRKIRILLTGYTAAALVIAVGFAVQFALQAATYRRYLQYEYAHAMSEVVGSMSQISGTLEKGVHCASPALMVSMSAEIWREAANAKSALSQLPLSSVQLDNTYRFMSQLGDYAFFIAKKAAYGEKLSDEELKSLEELSGVAQQFTGQLQLIQSDMNAGRLTVESISKHRENAQAGDANTVGGGMGKLEEEFPEYATLIYDGPLSDHIEKMTPVLLEGQAEISREDARQKAADFACLPAESLADTGEGNGKIATYRFTAEKNGRLYIDVCKNGGFVLDMLVSRDVVEPSMEYEDALEKARSFLKDRGYDSMKESYYMDTAGVLVVNFAYTQDDVTVYPDLIKVGIALDDGQVLRFESRGYIMSHKQRELPAPAVSAEEARAKLDERLTVESVGMAVIPTDGQHELLCYEFLCKDEEDNRLIVYCDAATGLEKQILVLVENDAGTLTI